MKYEFHVGDYVVFSNKYDTLHGYVKEYVKLTFNNEHCFIFQWDDGTQAGWGGNIQDLPHNFVRIGQCDFTKKDEGKIEPLAEEYTKSFSIRKPTRGVASSEWDSIDFGIVGKKINELVEVEEYPIESDENVLVSEIFGEKKKKCRLLRSQIMPRILGMFEWYMAR